jgi:uncharacterized protein
MIPEIPKAVLLALLTTYKWAVSPLFPPSCRYVPTCSEYAADAIARYGALCGAAMALWRILRCHPLAEGGYDPVRDLAPAASIGAREIPALRRCLGRPD